MKASPSFASRIAFLPLQIASRSLFRAAVVVLASLATLLIVPWGWSQTATGGAPVLLPQQAYKQFTPSEVVRLDWGSGENQVGLLKLPGGNYGPQSFAIDEVQKQIYILDSTNKRILIYGLGGSYISSLAISERADDVTLGTGGKVYILYRGDRKVIEYSQHGLQTAVYPLADTQSPITGIHFIGGQGVSVETADEHSYLLSQQSARVGNEAQSAEKTKGLRRKEGWLYLERGDTGQGSISFLNSAGEVINSFVVKSKGQTIEMLSLVGLDDEGNYYIAVEESSESLLVKRYVREYDTSGTLLAEAMLPYSAYVYTFKDLRVTGDGTIYQLLPLKEHVEVLSWNLNAGDIQPSADFVNHLFSNATVGSQEFIPGDAPLVGREQVNARAEAQPEASVATSTVLSRAESYRTHVFTVGSGNITSGVSCGGKTVQTYITSAGSHTGVPYKWGGFSGLTGVTSFVDPNTHYNFDEGLAAGEYAGDINTNSNYGSSCAAGVDCSGFISQVWGLSTEQNTGSLPGYACCLNSSCTYPSVPSYPSYIMPGDILDSDYVGHVVLVSTRNVDGSFTVYEASANNWVVAENPYTVQELSSGYYYPYRGREVINSLQAGNSVQTSENVNVGFCAGTTCAVVCTAPSGSIGTLSGTPQDTGGYLWWQVTWNNNTGSCPNGTTGYSVGCYLQPYTNPLPAPTITFTVPNHTYGDAPFTVAATSNSSSAITYSVVSGPATISGSAVTLTGAGTVVLQASQAASGNYAAGTQNATFTVGGNAPTITFSAPNHTYGDAPFTVSATSNSSGAITYSVVSGPATISGSTVTLTGAGTVVLSANQVASGSYGAAATTTSFAVAPGFMLWGSGSTSATTTSGGTATYGLTLNPGSGLPYPDALTLSATGQPTGATVVFTPQTVPAGSGTTNVTLAIKVPQKSAALNRNRDMGRGLVPVALGLLLLPFAGRMRRSGKRLGLLACVLLLLAGAVSLAGIAGCGSSTGGSSQTYIVVVTATDVTTGTRISTNLTLTVE